VVEWNEDTDDQMGVTKQFEPQRLADGLRYEDLPRGSAENGEILATDKTRISTDLNCHNRSTLLPLDFARGRHGGKARPFDFASFDAAHDKQGRKDTKNGRHPRRLIGSRRRRPFDNAPFELAHGRRQLRSNFEHERTEETENTTDQIL
jgi:hypothetical protein